MLFDSTEVGEALGILTIAFYALTIWIGINLWLLTKQPFTKIYVKLGIKRKYLTRMHCPAAFLAAIFALSHGISNFGRCRGTTWIAVVLLFVTCFTGFLFSKLSVILPKVKWKKKKTILRIIHFGLQIAIIIIVATHFD